jgi:hypothetical protein
LLPLPNVVEQLLADAGRFHITRHTVHQPRV